MDTDCDDAGAIAMLLQAHLAGRIELLGVIADAVSSYAAPFCEVMLRQYGLSLPIGTVYEDGYGSDERDIQRFLTYRIHSERMLAK